MKKVILMAAAALVLTASIAAAEGMNLSWNDCGTSGVSNVTFACNTNAGAPFPLVASFVAPTGGLPELLGMGMQIDITTNTGSVVDWWKHGTGQCRGTTGLTASLDFTAGPFSCMDFWAGAALSGTAYDVAYNAPNRCRLLVQGAIPFDNRGPVDDVTEYYGAKVNIARGKSTGVGSCAGCSEPACIVLNEFDLFQPAAVGHDPVIFTVLNQNFVTWQTAPPGCPASTPTRNSSWGQVKSLYR